MLKAFSTPRNRNVTFILLAVTGVLAAAAVLVGVSDNPPGIFLAFAAAAAFVVAFVHPWRSVKSYAWFLLASAVGFVVMAVLHNVFEGVAGLAGTPGIFRFPLQVLAVVSFLLAVLVGPPAVLVGAVGIVLRAIRNRRRPSTDSSARA